MNKIRFLLIVLLVFAIPALCQADEDSIWERETLTNGFFGLNDQLADSGIEVGLGFTNIYQQNVHGGTSTHRRAGRFSGSYDFELTADMQKLLGIKGGTLFMHAEAPWSKSQGIDTPAVGSAFGVNADAGARRVLDVTELWYQQAFGNGFSLTFGKMDSTGFFETNAYANDETAQFLNAAFKNNPTVPLPDCGLGVVARYEPTDSLYVMAGALDAQADYRETGFKTAFGDEDYFVYLLEAGIVSDNGAYRIGIWNDPQPKANSDGSKNYRDDVGVYFNCDRMLVKENADPEDSQGLGAFFRYGYAPSKRNAITNFWSLGFQYQGLVDGRDDDVLGVGYAQGFFANTAASTYPEDSEAVCETYYNIQVTPWFSLSPSLQYVANTGGTGTTKDAVIFGLRAQVTF